MTIADVIEGGKMVSIRHEDDMLVATLADGSEVKSYFAIRYEVQNEEGNWITKEMIGCETPEETFQLARDIRNNGNISVRNMQVLDEGAYNG